MSSRHVPSSVAFILKYPSGEVLERYAQPGDTLFVLPETDSTPQIHPLSGLLPPGLWIKGWSWYFEVPGIVDLLLAQWATDPPDYVVIFPDLIAVGQPGIQPLIDFVQGQYSAVETVTEILFHGDAVIYALAAGD
jgi:hypothetical protein